MSGEQCGYCGRFMRLEDFGLEYGTEWVCSQQFDHIVADPDHWSVGSLDMAVRVAKARSGLDPDAAHQPEMFIDRMDAEWREPFWDRQKSRVLEEATDD